MSDYHFFTPLANLRRIHEAALRILSETGIRMEHAEMRERLAALGCDVVGDRVEIPVQAAEDAIARIPPGFSVYGRTVGIVALVDADGPLLCANTGILPNVCDLADGRVRKSTAADVEATTRILDALPNVDLVYVSLLDATEQAPHLVTLVDFARSLANTTKPLIGPGVVDRGEAEAVVALARALRGPNVASFPPCVPFICPISPLRFPNGLVDALTVVASAGLPLEVVANPVMGVTSPYTVAGAVALGHAEVVAAAVMAQAVRPGLPVLNGNTPSVADMRTAASTTGGPETGLIRRTVAELSHYLRLPSFVHGHTSSARLDFQAGDEKALNTLLLASARPSILGGLGGLANVTVGSYEALLLDDERFGAVRRVLAGVAVDDEHLGLDAIARAVAGEEILGQEHTLRHLRSGEVWRPSLAVRGGLSNGAAPADTSVERARALVRRILQTHTVPSLPSGVQAAIDEIITAYDERETKDRG